MAHKIKLSLFSSLFRFFSLLSDKSRGNAFFVKYKVLLGSLIIGLSLSGCGSREEIPEKKEEPSDSTIMCYLAGPLKSASAPDENNKIDSIKIGE